MKIIFLIFVIYVNVGSAFCADYIRMVVPEYDTILINNYFIKNDTLCVEHVNGYDDKCYSLSEIESIGFVEGNSFVELINYSIERVEVKIQEVKRDSLVYINTNNVTERISKSEIYSYCINANNAEHKNVLHEDTFLKLYRNNKKRYYTITKKDKSNVSVFSIVYIDNNKVSVEWEHSQKDVETIIKKNNILTIKTDYQTVLWDNQIKEDYVFGNDNKLELIHINKINEDIRNESAKTIAGKEIFILDILKYVESLNKEEYYYHRKIAKWGVYAGVGFKHFPLSEYLPGSYKKTSYNSSTLKEDYFKKGKNIEFNIDRYITEKFSYGVECEYIYAYTGFRDIVKENINYGKYGVRASYYKMFRHNEFMCPISVSMGGASVYTVGIYTHYITGVEDNAKVKVTGNGYYYKVSSGVEYKLKNAFFILIKVAYTGGKINNRKVDFKSNMKSINSRDQGVDNLSNLDFMLGLKYKLY